MATPATGAADRHAGGLERHRGGADRAHRRGAVRLQRVGDDADDVGELLLARDRRRQGALGERAVADVAALGAAHEAGLAHRERREVVVVPEALGVLEAEVVDLHVHPRRAERDAREDLRLAAGEQRRAVHARRDVDLALDRPDLVLRATVGALLVDGDPLADRCPSRACRRRAPTSAASCVGLVVVAVGAYVVEDLLLDGLDRLLARELLGHLGGLVELLAVRADDLLEQRLVDRRRLDLELLLAGLPRSSSIAPMSFLISPWAMSRASSTSASVTPSAPHSTIRIASSVPETTRSISSSSSVSSSGLTTKSPSSLPTRTAPTCLATGTGEIASAAEAPFIARMS